MAAKVIELYRTYRAKLTSIESRGLSVRIAGTLDGYVDLAIQAGGIGKTYNLSTEEASKIADGLLTTIKDINGKCLYDEDALLARGDPEVKR